MSGGLHNGARMSDHVQWVSVSIRWSEYVNPSGVIRGLSGGLVCVQMYIQALTQDWKVGSVYVSRLVRTRIGSFLHASAYLVLVGI